MNDNQFINNQNNPNNGGQGTFFNNPIPTGNVINQPNTPPQNNGPVNNQAVPANQVNSNPATGNAPVTIGPVTNNVTYAETLGNINEQANANNPNNVGLDNMNVAGAYNNMEAATPGIINNDINQEFAPKKKNTITITKELKLIFILVAILFIFIMIMPYISNIIDGIINR